MSTADTASGPDLDRLATQQARFQQVMEDHDLCGLLLGSEVASRFVGGHRRIAVHMPGWPIPITIVPRGSLPHVVTADADGAQHLPAGNVHGMMWNPAILSRKLGTWLDAGPGSRVGVDITSPGGTELIASALPEAEIVDAHRMLAQAMLPKDAQEVSMLGAACAHVHTAAAAGLEGGMQACIEALAGAFPVVLPRVSKRSVALACVHRGVLGVAAIGPGDPAVGREALTLLVPGAAMDDVARRLPPAVEVIAIGSGYQPPVLRGGRCSPDGLELVAGSVLVVRWEHCAVTVVVGDRPSLLSPDPEEVAR